MFEKCFTILIIAAIFIQIIQCDDAKLLPGSPIMKKINGKSVVVGMLTKYDENGEPVYTMFNDDHCKFFVEHGLECKNNNEVE